MWGARELNAYPSYQILSDRGVPVELVTYPREGHGIREPMHQRDMMKRIWSGSRSRLFGWARMLLDAAGYDEKY